MRNEIAIMINQGDILWKQAYIAYTKLKLLIV